MLARLALEHEQDLFVELSRLAVEESAPHTGFDPEVVRETFRGYLKTATPTIFFVEQGREIVGFLLATINQYRHSACIYTTQEVLFVRPDKRGTRAAVTLLDEFVRWSNELGAIESTGGNDNNLFTESTARLLESRGFERVGIFMRRRAVNLDVEERRQ